MRRPVERVIEGGLFTSALLSVATTIGIIVVLATEAIGFLREVPILEFLLGTQWTPLFANPRFGVLPLVAGTGPFAIGHLVPELAQPARQLGLERHGGVIGGDSQFHRRPHRACPAALPPQIGFVPGERGYVARAC